MSDDVRIEFELVPDNESIARIEQGLKNIAKEQQKVASEFQKGNITLAEATARQKQLNASKQELLSLEKALNAESDEALRKQEKALELERQQTEEAKSGLRAKQERFDTISQDVSLAGDFQSNLGALRGLSAAAGLGGVSEGLDIGGEVVALVEELPRLGAAAAGLPATLAASKAALLALSKEALAALPGQLLALKAGLIAAGQGVVTFLIGLGPIALAALAAGAAIMALIAIFSIFKSSTEEATKVTEAQIEAEKLSTEQAQDRLSQIEDEKSKVQELIAIREESGQKTDDLKEREKELNEESDALNTTLESGANAINDVSKAEEELAEKRRDAAAEAADDAATLEELRQKVRDSNSEELANLQQDLQDRKAVLEAERDALKASGDTSEETQAQLVKLNDSIGDLEEQLNFATSATAKAATAENDLKEKREQQAKEAERQAKEAEREAERQAKEAEREAENRRKEAQRQAKKIADEARKRAEKRIDIQKKADDDLLKLQEKYNKDSRKAFVDAQREEAKATRDADKSRKDLLKELSRQEEDLIASGDIFAIQDIREQASENLADLRADFDYDANERKIQRRNEANDRLQEAQEQRLKLRQNALAQLQELSGANKAIRTGWRGMLTGLGNDLQTFSNAITGNTQGRRPTATGSQSINVSIDGAPVRAIAQQELAAITIG
jgi:hypothetical protein